MEIRREEEGINANVHDSENAAKTLAHKIEQLLCERLGIVIRKLQLGDRVWFCGLCKKRRGRHRLWYSCGLCKRDVGMFTMRNVILREDV